MVGPSLKQLAAALLLLGVLGIVTHGRVIDNGYAYDALYTVRDNVQVRADATLVEIFSASYWGDDEAFSARGLYRPLMVLSFQLTRRVWDEPIAVDHAVDLGLHVLCSLALLAFLMQMGARGGVAMTLSTLFLLHPVQTEVVASLVGRSDLLATLLALLSMNLALAGRISRVPLWIGLWALFSLSLLAKESTVGLLVLLPTCWVVREVWRGRAPSMVVRRALALGACLGLALVCNLVLRQIVLGNVFVPEPAILDDDALGFFELRWRALAFMTLYPQKLLWPHPLLPDYIAGVVPGSGLGLNLRALGAGVMLFASAAWPAWTWLRHRSLTRVQLGILLFWIAIAPVSNLIIQIGTPFGERLLYFPMIFLLLAAIDLPLWRPVAALELGLAPRLWPVWIAVAVAFGIISAQRIPEWKDNKSLFRAAVRDSPGNYHSQLAYAAALMREGGFSEQREVALRAVEEAARMSPDASSVYEQLGTLAFKEGRFGDAQRYLEDAYQRATRGEGEDVVVKLSRTYRALKDFERVESSIVRIASENLEWHELQRELGDYLSSRGRIPEALAYFERALPGNAKDKTLWRDVIWSHLLLGQRERAVERLEASPPGTLDYRFKLRLKGKGFILPGM